jgi:hypothetical protein
MHVSVPAPCRIRDNGTRSAAEPSGADRVTYDPERAAAYYDEYGEQERTRFEQARMGAANFGVHAHYLRRYVRPGDAAVCYGGPLSYVLDRADRAVAELVRVVRRGGHVLVSAMSLVGAIAHYADGVLELAARDGPRKLEDIVETGFLPEEPDYGHLPIRLYRWPELRELLSRHGDVVAGAAAGLLQPTQPPAAPELRDLLLRLELDLGAGPAAIDGGEHLLAVLRKP